MLLSKKMLNVEFLFLTIVYFSHFMGRYFFCFFRYFLPITTKKFLIGRRFFVFGAILLKFLLTIRDDFFCRGRNRLKQTKILLPTERFDKYMVRNALDNIDKKKNSIGFFPTLSFGFILFHIHQIFTFGNNQCNCHIAHSICHSQQHFDKEVYTHNQNGNIQSNSHLGQ